VGERGALYKEKRAQLISIRKYWGEQGEGEKREIFHHTTGRIEEKGGGREGEESPTRILDT